MNSNKIFKPINQIIEDFPNLLIDDKLNTLRKLSEDVIYNSDYQNSLCQNNFIIILLNDFIENISIDNCDIIQNKNYLRLFFLLFHNLIIGSHSNKSLVFTSLFLNPIHFNNLIKISNYLLNDIKFTKFILSIFYNLLFTVENNLLQLNQSHIEYFITIISSVNYESIYSDDKNTRDANDINDWLHILIQNILLNQNLITENKITFCDYLLNVKDEKMEILFLELFRDYVDYAKDNKTLSISNLNLNHILNKFIENLKEILDFIMNSNLHSDYENYQMNNDDKVSYTFRRFICFVDLLSVFLIHEEQNEFRIIIQKMLNDEEKLIYTFKNFLINTDKVYDEIFKRNKSLTKEQGIGVAIINEKNILYGFQTNVMKFLSNFALKNELLKNIFVEDPMTLMYFLNNMKLDKCNPFKKEWTVLFVKAVTEGNEKIKNFIRELRPAQIDPLLKDYIVNKGNVNVGDKIENFKKEKEDDSDEKKIK